MSPAHLFTCSTALTLAYGLDGADLGFYLVVYLLGVGIPLFVAWLIIKYAVVAALRQHDKETRGGAPPARSATPGGLTPRQPDPVPPRGYKGGKVLNMIRTITVAGPIPF